MISSITLVLFAVLIVGVVANTTADKSTDSQVSIQIIRTQRATRGAIK